ncbi:MAG: isoleucine--tRNA ligase [Chlamydiia bacterium]|nr:isoleucine--tRNA ligase [Chlamydiia bacterium]
MFKEIESESFAAREERILRFWKKEQIFFKSLEQRRGSVFTYYDGPPFATGLPHYGHLLAGTIKDVVCRFQTMIGQRVDRRFGWDCHGLPVENEVEKKHNLSGAPSIVAFGIDKFNEECRNIVLQYEEQWEKIVARIGRWVDFSRTWKTMDLPFMESVWWVFKQIYNQGLIYEGFKVMPFSAKLGTPLSNFEAGENYQDIDDPSLIVSFPLRDNPETSLIAWTTTPWTLISNLALTVGEEIEYVTLVERESSKRYILAKNAVSYLFPDQNKIEIIGSMIGQELIGRKYSPIFPYFAEREDAFKVIPGEFVSTEEGTGIVHTAPAFGEDDFEASKKANIGIVCPVDENGRFTKEVPEYQGQFVKDADKAIIQRLKEIGRLVRRGTIRHRYPFCWRSDTPLIYRAVTTWFVSVEQIRDKLLKANEQIHWVPSHLKEGRFGNWLEGARDWAFSRNRYWGTPIPIWRADDGEIHVVGSVKELEILTGATVTDLHRHHIDGLYFEKNGKLFKRIAEVFDCWFESGSMPYGQNHYPFENKEMTEKHFPADFIAEGIDQTRGWFYTLTVLGAALFDQPAFKNVVVNGIVLAEDGNKMSKRLKNYPEPERVINKYGADAVRLYLLYSPAVKGDDLRFSEKGVELILRQILIPLWNAYAFFITYARIYKWKPSGHHASPERVIDKWILSQLAKLIKEVRSGMDDFDLNRAVEPFVGFIDQLTNWYIRRSRRRFWADEDTPDRRQAFETLHTCLLDICKIAAPFIPFISDAMYGNLRAEEMSISVHLCDFPREREENRNVSLEEGMNSLMVAVSLGHSLRKEHKIKVRQPLPAVHIVSRDPLIIDFLSHQKHLVADELNVKDVKLHKEPREFVKHTIRPNFRVLGKKVGAHMKEVKLMIEAFTEEEINTLLHGRNLSLHLDKGGEFLLTPEDVEISHTAREGWIAMNAGNVTIALDTQLSEELLLEGIARELVNKINMMRRQANLDVTDRVNVRIGTTDRVKKTLLIHGDYVKEEVLALELFFDYSPESTQWDINGEPAAIAIERVIPMN